MSRQLLDIIKDAVRAKGVTAPPSIVSSDDFALQLLNLAKETAADLLSRPFDWQSLQQEALFTTVAGETQINLRSTYPYLKKIVDGTVWNRTLQQPMKTVSVQAWQSMKATGFAATPYIYRLRGGVWIMPDDTDSGQTISFEYIDERPWADAGGNRLLNPSSDSDVFLLPDNLMLLGVRWRFLEAKGLEYGESFRLYEDQISKCMSDDKPADTLSINGTRGGSSLCGPSTSEGNWSL